MNVRLFRQTVVDDHDDERKREEESEREGDRQISKGGSSKTDVKNAGISAE